MWNRRNQNPGSAGRPLPAEFLEWQVKLRAWTMHETHGAPHAGVAPLLVVRQPGLAVGVSSHSIICGLLPAPGVLDAKTVEFRELYEAHIGDGARAVYDQGIAYLKNYYEEASAFDPGSITTLLPRKLPVVDALRSETKCALVFYVFDLVDKSEVGRLRCLHVDCEADVLESGPVYDNVWWHNTLFHGPADEHVVIHFRHRGTWDTRFGALDEVAS
ncbi:MAG: hypothetical protein AAF430_08875 [Myxococcota bacterium]